jgi:hypothetical protein
MTPFGRFFVALLLTSLANAAEIKVLIAGALQNGIGPWPPTLKNRPATRSRSPL